MYYVYLEHLYGAMSKVLFSFKKIDLWLLTTLNKSFFIKISIMNLIKAHTHRHYISIYAREEKEWNIIKRKKKRARK